MIHAAVIGAAGYTGGELLRLLLTHPAVSEVTAISKSHDGQSLIKAHPDLLHWRDLSFVAELKPTSLDVVFLCGGHGESRRLLAQHRLLERDCLLIDLSQDFRLNGPDHDFIYGLPEASSTKLANCRRIANPGCFATAIQLALLPLAERGWLEDEVHITGLTGSTGAGQKLRDSLHFSYRHDNVSVYKPFAHQHLTEICHTLRSLQPNYQRTPLFVPMRGQFTRGILVSVHTKISASAADLMQAFDSYYQEAPFVHRTTEEADLKQVINTNNALVSCQKYGDYAHIVCCLDNLIKGASGQAVQNMNLALGLKETDGLILKPSAF